MKSTNVADQQFLRSVKLVDEWSSRFETDVFAKYEIVFFSETVTEPVLDSLALHYLSF